MSDHRVTDDLLERARLHAALGEPARLAIVEDLSTSDRSPKELGERLGLPSNLLAHHLDTLEHAGIVERLSSAGDGRRRYVRLLRESVDRVVLPQRAPIGPVLFLCTANSARSQLAAAAWTARTGRRATCAGTRPAERVHVGAAAAARRAGLSLDHARPRLVRRIPAKAQVITVCDLVHEELEPGPDWWHWSIPDPVPTGDPAAFDAALAELDARIAFVTGGQPTGGPRR